MSFKVRSPRARSSNDADTDVWGGRGFGGVEGMGGVRGEVGVGSWGWTGWLVVVRAGRGSTSVFLPASSCTSGCGWVKGEAPS